MLASRRWRDWRPPKQVENVSESELPKPPKPGSVSFGSHIYVHLKNTSPLESVPQHDPTAWREPVAAWLASMCVRNRRCYSSITCLHGAYCDWELSHDDVPCPLNTFERLLQQAGFLIVDEMVTGLILQTDFAGVRVYPEINRLLCRYVANGANAAFTTNLPMQIYCQN